MQAIETGVMLFGGTARTDEQHDTALGDSWLFSVNNKTWINLDLEPGTQAPYPRCVACAGLDRSVDSRMRGRWRRRGSLFAGESAHPPCKLR